MNRHVVLGDRSVTFRHQENKENQSWIMLIYSNLNNYFPNECGVEAWVLIDVLGVVANGYGTCCCHLLTIWLVLCYYSIYIAFYFELADDTYSVRVPCTDPYLYFSLCICGVQQTCYRLRLVRNSSQSSVYQNSGWATVSSSDWTLSFTSWCLEVRTWTISFTYFSFIDTLRFRKLRIDVLVMMTSRFWG